MKLYKYSLALVLGLGTLTSCEDKLEVSNPNQQTTATFGFSADELEENVIAAYNHIRMEGTYARVGYTLDVCRGDEVWNASQVWYMPFDDLNVPFTDEIGQWSWRDWYYTINVTNFTLSRCGEDNSALNEQMKRIKGQMLFLRGLAYYNLAGYYQNPILITDYNTYSSLEGLYGTNSTYDEVWDQVEKDFAEAMTLLPSRNEGGQWAKGRATNGAAAGYYARALMMRHKYSEALTVLKAIINGQYGNYKLMANYGDNFREGAAYENNDESLFEVQYLDYGSQGTDDEWTPVNTSPNATQGHAIESNFGPGDAGGWADLSASPWLYNLFKAERTTNGSLDPRLYWTIGTYEPEWDGFEYGNVCYTIPMTADAPVVTNNNYGGLPVAKNTNFRTGLYDKVVTGLHCGINLRMMRYSDVLLRAAECENEGCEFGRGFDLIRWGFFYDAGRLQQLKEHGTFRRTNDRSRVKESVNYSDIAAGDTELKSSYDTWVQGHEFLPIFQGTLNDNPNLVGNSANTGTSNADKLYGPVHPVVNL